MHPVLDYDLFSAIVWKLRSLWNPVILLETLKLVARIQRTMSIPKFLGIYSTILNFFLLSGSFLCQITKHFSIFAPFQKRFACLMQLWIGKRSAVQESKKSVGQVKLSNTKFFGYIFLYGIGALSYCI